MNQVKFSEVERPTFRYGYPPEGAVVNYWVDPMYALGNEPRGRITAMVMTSGGFNKCLVQTVLVCPYGRPDNAPAPKRGLPSSEGPLILRPDLSTHVAISDLVPTLCNGEPVVCSKDFVKQARAQFLDLIKPAVAVMKSGQPIGKGTIKWFGSIPFSTAGFQRQPPGPGVCLTPLTKTGVVIVTRGDTDFTSYIHRANTPILSAYGYTANHVSASNLQAVSIERLSTKNTNVAVPLSLSVMAELFEKIEATLSREAYERVKEKYPGKKGALSPELQCALADWHSRRRGNQPGYNAQP